MAETRKLYVYSAFVTSLISVLLVIVAVSTDSWVVARATDQFVVSTDSLVRYGLFGGELELNTLATPTISALHVTCVLDVSACAVSCKTTAEARRDEVRALALGQRPNSACAAVTTIDSGTLDPAVIHSALYICVVLLVFLQLLFACASSCLALLNATKNPTEPVFGLPGCLWSNVVAASLGVIVLMTFGVYWSTSGLKYHLAFSYIATGLLIPSPGLGYSYWILTVAVLSSLSSVALIQYRKYLLERDPPPPTIKLENHSDGTVFLY